MGLGAFETALGDAKMSLVMNGSEAHLKFLSTCVDAVMKGEPVPAVSEGEMTLQSHCEQLRLRAISLGEGSAASKEWPKVADFVEQFEKAGHQLIDSNFSS